MTIHTTEMFEREPCKDPIAAQTQPVTFVVHSQGSMFAVKACQELLLLANQFSGQNLYQIDTSFDLRSAVQRVMRTAKQTFVLFGTVNDPWVPCDDVQKLLRVHLPSCARVALVGGASLIAAKTPCLKPHKICVHPVMMAAALEQNTRVDDSHAPTCCDGPVHSAIGGLAALHMVAAMIAQDGGVFLSQRVMDYVGLGQTGTGLRTEQENRYFQLSAGHPLLTQTISKMKANIETDLALLEIAKDMRISPRQLERLFRKVFDESPMEVYRILKLERADQLIHYCDMPLIEVSIASGFGSVAQLSKWYRNRYGVSPSQARAVRYRLPSF